MRRGGLLVATMALTIPVLPSAEVGALPPPADTFHGLTPARLLDTRTGAPTVDGAQSGQGALGAGQTLLLEVAGRAGIPVHDVGAVALNVTAINPTAPSFVTVWPTGVARPLASNLNLAPGRTLPNMVMVPVGADGNVQLYNDKGATHLAADVLGWFPKGTAFGGVTPARLLDTRDAPTVDGLQSGEGAVGPGESLTLQVAGRGGVPPVGARAVALNVTAINPSAASFVTVWPFGVVRPFASNLNLAPGRTLPNMVVVPLGDDGKVELYNDKGSTHLAVDVLGWFATTTNFSGLTPARLADTRSGAPTTDGLGSGSGALGAGGSLTVDVAGRGGVPASGAGAVALNVTAVNPSAPSFLTVWPTGTNRPLASNLNLAPGRTLPNMVVVPLGADGKVQVYNDKGSTHVAIDVLGWFPTTVVAAHTLRVSVDSNGQQGNQSVQHVALSADGLTVAFSSDSANLVSGDTNLRFDVFVHQVLTGITTRVSVATGGGQVNDHSSSPSLSANGRYVAFQSQATNLVVGDTNAAIDVFVHDRFTVTTERVSIATGGAQGNAGSSSPSISADGRYVAFASNAQNLVPTDFNGASDIFVHDRDTGTTERVSLPNDFIEANGSSFSPAISGDGRFVAFWSNASNLVAGDDNGVADVFVRDRLTGVTERVSVATGNVQANATSSGAPSISADGRFVAFRSDATNLVVGDTNASADVFVHDRTTGVTTLITRASNGDQANDGSEDPSLSADGRYVAYSSGASNLVAGDTNGVYDVFVHDRLTGVTVLASRSTAGALGDDESYYPRLSGNGRYVAFESSATNLVAGDTNADYDTFWRDLGTL